MNDEEIAQLQNYDEWDVEAGERQRAPRGNRAIVSVGFKTADFTLVSEAAEKRDQPLSQFIREAALDRARERDAERLTRRSLAIIVPPMSKHIEASLLEAMQRHRRLSALG
jgi:uncharacterized protein (DUF1778 family)